MAVSISYSHIDTPPGEPARLRRTPRVRVAQIVMDYLAHGWSAEEMCRQHPYLTPAEVHAAMAYYFDHQSEMDHEIWTEWEEAKAGRATAPRSPFGARMRTGGSL